MKYLVKLYVYICMYTLYNCVTCWEEGLQLSADAQRCVTPKRLRITIKILDCCGMGTLPLKQMGERNTNNPEIMNVHQMWVLRAWYPAGQVENSIHPKLPRAICQY